MLGTSGQDPKQTCELGGQLLASVMKIAEDETVPSVVLFQHPGHPSDAGSSGHFTLMSSLNGEGYGFFKSKQNMAFSFLLNHSEAFVTRKTLPMR